MVSSDESGTGWSGGVTNGCVKGGGDAARSRSLADPGGLVLAQERHGVGRGRGENAEGDDAVLPRNHVGEGLTGKGEGMRRRRRRRRRKGARTDEAASEEKEGGGYLGLNDLF
jgi:hypothetical protein